MTERTIDDCLRKEYFELLPSIKRVMVQLEAEVKFELIDISKDLKTYERFNVTSRVKDCESAVNALLRRQEGRIFDKEKAEEYSLTQLHDLAGIRVLVFPRGLVDKVNGVLLNRFNDWTADPVRGFDVSEILAHKYYGYTSNDNYIIGEIQIVPMLTGLFWEVEHAAMYKPDPAFKGVATDPEMKQKKFEVLDSLKSFEETFENLIKENSK